VRARNSGEPAKRRDRAVRAAARDALAALLEPLAGFALDAGLSVQEVETLLRVAAVRSAAQRQREVQQRVNISGIAASTGISRAEISRILKAPARTEPAGIPKAREQQATNRILSAWHEDPRFTKPDGQPADLKIFGTGATFDALVKEHGRGLPTRAMLDELARAQALEVLPGQKVRAKALVAAYRGASPRAIKAFGERATQLLATLLATVRDPHGHQFVTHIEGAVRSIEALPILRREVAELAEMLFAKICPSAIAAVSKKKRTDATQVKDRFVISVICCSETRLAKQPSLSAGGRRNLRRLP
jgi:hypothetical protein